MVLAPSSVVHVPQWIGIELRAPISLCTWMASDGLQRTAETRRETSKVSGRMDERYGRTESCAMGRSAKSGGPYRCAISVHRFVSLRPVTLHTALPCTVRTFENGTNRPIGLCLVTSISTEETSPKRSVRQGVLQIPCGPQCLVHLTQ